MLRNNRYAREREQAKWTKKKERVRDQSIDSIDTKTNFCVCFFVWVLSCVFIFVLGKIRFEKGPIYAINVGKNPLPLQKQHHAQCSIAAYDHILLYDMYICHAILCYIVIHKCIIKMCIHRYNTDINKLSKHTHTHDEISTLRRENGSLTLSSR